MVKKGEELDIDELLKLTKKMEEFTRRGMPAGLELNLQEIKGKLEELDKTLSTAFIDYIATINTFTEKITGMTNALTGAIDKILDVSKTLAEAVNTMASRGGVRRQVQTKPITEFTLDGLPERIKSKFKIDRSTPGKIVVRSEGYLGNDKEDSKKMWAIATRHFEKFGIKWHKENNDYRWEN